MTLQDEAFIQAILEDPQEEANWLVYADWLEERGDPRSELFRRRRLTNSSGIDFVLVPRGSFWMGGGRGKPGEKHVEMPHEFYLGVYPVTQGQWRDVMGGNPSYFARTGGGAANVATLSDADLKQFPVEDVSWNEVQEFIRKLNQREEAHSKGVYRLPTEEEWEYGCRGGASSKEDCSFDFYLDRATNDLCSTQANFYGNYPAGDAAEGPDLERSTKVGSYQPNALGLYDLHGNVCEWTDSVEGPCRVIRGGGWSNRGCDCRAASHSSLGPSSQRTYLGFRIALSLSDAQGS